MTLFAQAVFLLSLIGAVVALTFILVEFPRLLHNLNNYLLHKLNNYLDKEISRQEQVANRQDDIQAKLDRVKFRRAHLNFR